MQKEGDSVMRWNGPGRRTVWTIIARVRFALNLEIAPTIATAHCLLQKYFENTVECPYEMFILMIAALFTTCKANNNYRSLEVIFNELRSVCSKFPSPEVREMVTKITFSDKILTEIANAEIELLASNRFDINVALPFGYFDKWKVELQRILPDDDFIKICNSVIVDICLLICSRGFLDSPAEAGAAVAIQNMLVEHGSRLASYSEETHKSLLEWLRSIREKYGDKIFDQIDEMISSEKSRTVARRSG